MGYATEMHFLYNTKIVHEAFNKERFFRFLQDDSFSCAKKVTKEYSKHEVLIKEKEKNEGLFFIEEGYVMATQKNRVVSLHTSGDIIGFEDLILYSHAKYSFKAISDKVRIIKYNKAETVEKILNAQEGYLYYYIHLQNTLQHLRTREELLRLPSEQRISLVLLRFALSYGMKNGNTTKVWLPKYINKGIIAKYSNLNPNTVTVTLQKLEAAEIIESVRREIYVNVEKLQDKLLECHREVDTKIKRICE
ncbi:hypothetical protein PGRAN_16227 [Listeria grandensis FSL F6-0971]|uniref:Cyclic nucleotide-binding domain-containing protein n=2 Tax=Listeria grandensis TaxID=1494963 RepID=W7BB66_9LIST|nr:hypothetical protein PGRAN_16227 [Listeria grandensis FSL F6-0971]